MRSLDAFQCVVTYSVGEVVEWIVVQISKTGLEEEPIRSGFAASVNGVGSEKFGLTNLSVEVTIFLQIIKVRPSLLELLN